MNLPKIDQKVIDLIFSQLEEMEVELDENPLIFGPKRLNGKIAAARTFQTECENLFLKVSLWLQKYRSASRAARLNLDLSKKHLMTNDPEVRAGRNVADRDAIASMKLRDEVTEVSDAENTLQNLEAVLVVIKSKKSDLKDTQSRIRDQIRLCQEEISLGARWGNKRFGEVEKPEEVDPNKQTLKDLHNMFNSPEEVVKKESNLIEGTFEPGMEDFLNEIDKVEVEEDSAESQDNPVLIKKDLDIDALLSDMGISSDD